MPKNISKRRETEAVETESSQSLTALFSMQFYVFVGRLWYTLVLQLVEEHRIFS